jgi:hypothetical protein
MKEILGHITEQKLSVYLSIDGNEKNNSATVSMLLSALVLSFLIPEIMMWIWKGGTDQLGYYSFALGNHLNYGEQGKHA